MYRSVKRMENTYTSSCLCINTYTHTWCVFVFSYIFSYIWFKNTCVFLKENPPQQNSHLKNARLVVSRKERYLNAARKQIGGACRSKQKVSRFFWVRSKGAQRRSRITGNLEISMVKNLRSMKKKGPNPWLFVGNF